MCGITGWIDWEQDLTRPAAMATLASMTASLAHRGPDADGCWHCRHAAFGHRRLAVIDPAGGAQPMIRRRGGGQGQAYVITYNGELYNTAEVRAELEARGETFRTHCDTEVVLAAYMVWGPACVERFNGIFAIGIWDGPQQRLFLARDRMGVKPLFYTERPDQGAALLFASELKALLRHPAVPAELDREGLAEVLIMGPSRTPGHGIFRGVKELRPGHALLHDRSGTRLYPYWQLQSHAHPDDVAATADTVRDLLLDAIERQLVSDVPICTLLSGGLDSSTISAVAARALRRDGKPELDTYSVDFVGSNEHFPGNQYYTNPDAPFVQRMVEEIGSHHHAVIFDTPEQVAHLPAAALYRDHPGMADIDASLLLFCREIKRGATVALSGECADEVFGGYPWFHRRELVEADGFPWIRMVPERAALLSPEVRAAIAPEAYVERRYREACAEVPRLLADNPSEARMRELLYLCLTRFMPTLLDRKDRMSMASGLEVRVPFCDHRLVEYVWNIPWAMKCDAGTGEPAAKGILRRALAGVLPEDVRLRRKSPYPKTHNPSFLNATRAWAQEVVEDPASPVRAFLDMGAVREAIRTDAATLAPAWFGQTMGAAQWFAYVAMTDAWMREYGVFVR
ncbi:MAG TPA: asparagine synthase (glutamine-hydrolyzing) [Bacillota bacterium]|nr:asparagine synthase (glutamine-hydrolyzing) [Bacillota bacterium]